MAPVASSPAALGLKQCLLVMGLLLGLLLMHGVTGHHDIPADSTPTWGVADGDRADMMSHPSGTAGSETQVVSAAITCHPMAAMCVAILATGLLLPLLTLFGFKRRNQDLLSLSPAVRSMLPGAAAARWLIAPSLTRLCVSRT